MTLEIDTDTTQSTYAWTAFLSIAVCFVISFISRKLPFQYGFKPQMKWFRLLASHFARRRLTRLIRDSLKSNNEDDDDEQESLPTVSGIFVYPGKYEKKTDRIRFLETNLFDHLIRIEMNQCNFLYLFFFCSKIIKSCIDENIHY